MKITMTSTDILTTLDGAGVRLWEGTTEAGVRCKVFVARLAVHKDQDAAQFERELREMGPPAELQAVPLREVL